MLNVTEMDAAPSINDESAEQDEAETLIDEPTLEATTAEASSAQAYQDLNNQYLRLAADFDNFRKRTLSEREALLKNGAHATVETFLPVLDNLDRAFQSLSESSDAKTLFQSLRMMQQQLGEALSQVGVAAIEAEGTVFDPEKHEAVSRQESADHPADTVMQVYQKGYMLHDRVIRPAQVGVSAESQNEQAEPVKEANPFQAG